MTLREKHMLDHPNEARSEDGYPLCCPCKYGYADDPEWCRDPKRGTPTTRCNACWDREMPEETRHILDSGSKTEFTTGAVRDSREGKGRCDLLPLDVVCQYYYDIGLDIAFSIFELIGYFEASGNPVHLLEVLKYFCEDRWDKDCNSMFLETSKQYGEGAEKYGENNWKNGMPVKIYIDSAVRHYLKFLRGDKDEYHDRAFAWNLMCAIWTCKHKPELNDYAKRDTSEVESVIG